MNRTVIISAPVVSLMLLLGACGGGGGDKQVSATTRPTTATTAAGGLGAIPAAALLAQRCANYGAFAGAIGLSLAAAMDPNAAKQLEDLKAKINLDEAPEEIKGDFAVITAYAADLGKVLAKYKLQSGQPDPQAIAAIAEFSQNVDTVRLQKAGSSISAWVTAHCTR